MSEAAGGGLTLACGRISLQQKMNEVSIVIECPSDEEADLTFTAIVEAWKQSGKLVLVNPNRAAGDRDE